MRYHFTRVKMAIIKKIYKLNTGETVEKRELSYTADGNANWYKQYGEWYGCHLRNKKQS